MGALEKGKKKCSTNLCESVCFLAKLFLSGSQRKVVRRLWRRNGVHTGNTKQKTRVITPSKGRESWLQSSASSLVQWATLSMSLAFKTSSSLYMSSMRLWMWRRMVSRRVARFSSSTPKHTDTMEQHVMPRNIKQATQYVKRVKRRR